MLLSASHRQYFNNNELVCPSHTMPGTGVAMVFPAPGSRWFAPHRFVAFAAAVTIDWSGVGHGVVG